MNYEFKGTQGEWFVSNNVSGIGVLSRRFPAGIDTIASSIYEQFHKQQTQANAKLIAAAPKMFDMLKESLNRIEKLCVYATIPPEDCGQYKNDIKQLLSEITK